MGNKIRIRCPICGMLVWQSRLSKDFNFEFVIQQSSGRGYKQIEHKYKSAYMADTDIAKIFQTVLAMKMIEKAEELLKKIDVDIKIDVQIPDEAKEEFTKSYEEVAKEKQEVRHEVDYEVEKPKNIVYEFEVAGQEYEIEIPTLQVEDVKRSFFKRQRGPQKIEEMVAIREFEIGYDVKDVEYEVESFLRMRR